SDARPASSPPTSDAGYGALVLGSALAHPSMLFAAAVVAGLRVLVGGLHRIAEDRRRSGGIQVGVAAAAAGMFVLVSGTLLGGMDLTRPSQQGPGEVLREI